MPVLTHTSNKHVLLADAVLEGEYQGREEWQAVAREGAAQGWLLTPDQVGSFFC